MNENMMLNPGESILFMSNGSGGKMVNTTRVFTTVEEFRNYVRENANIMEAYPGRKVGDTVHSYTYTYGPRKGSTSHTILVREGHHVSMWGQFYVASPDKPPKRFELTAEMIGMVSVKTKTKNIKPST